MKSNALLAALPLLLALGTTGLPAELWWERGAATWCYKDDWKALALTGARSFSKTFDIPAGAASGWIIIWGDRGYALSVNGKAVGSNIDGGLIDDYDLSPFLAPDTKAVTLRIDGDMVCAEGEVVGRDGKRYPYATGEDWQVAGGGKLQTKKMEAGPSTGAFHRAHNGRLLSYNDEERGKTAIARCLARIQKLREHDLFLMRRLRPPDEILSFAPGVRWRMAELALAPLLRERPAALTEAIRLQHDDTFQEALKHAEAADAVIAERVAEVQRVITRYREWRQVRRDHSEATLRGGGRTGWCGPLDEFPEDRFAWLNARELMENDPATWPFTVAPSSCAYRDLAGQWLFRTDPNNEGEKSGWHLPEYGGGGWRVVFAPRPWERQGITDDNLRSPGDCPYKLVDARCGDKPYNGFAWYRKSLVVPEDWRGKKVLLATGRIANWARIFVNGTPLGEGRQNPPTTQEIAANLLRFGKENVLTIQVYNHDNFGGIVAGPLALYLAGGEPDSRETPGPLSYTVEHRYPTPDGPVRCTVFASALSPAVIVATDGAKLELGGWDAKWYKPPSQMAFVVKDGPMRVNLTPSSGLILPGQRLAENWLLLAGGARDILVVLERQPEAVLWHPGEPRLSVGCDHGPVRAALLVMPQGVKLDDAECRWWARALRAYPVTATEMVKPGNPQTCWIRYNYLHLDGFGDLAPLDVAPVPMLFSYGLRHEHPGLAIRNARTTSYHSQHAPYRVVENSVVVEYQAPPVDRSKVKKGVGELFAKRKAEHNVRGGLSEDEMFRRMGEWGFDHCRYAWAFQADWDLPLVKFVGGPLIEDNEACWKRLDDLVEKCNKAGMQMMLCWFFNEDQPQKDTGGAVRNSTRYWRAHPEAQKNAFELWRRIAARYADRPEGAIAYDFFNEPAYINTDHWNEIIRELTAVIRSVDKKHLIVWESADGWAQPQWCLWMAPAKDTNVLYSFHHYGKHWGYAYDEYYPSYRCTTERSQIDPWLDAILFSIKHNVPIHCGEFGISMVQPEDSGERWLDDYLAMFHRFGIGWNWWNYAGDNIYRTGLAAGNRISPCVPILRKWMDRRGPQ